MKRKVFLKVHKVCLQDGAVCTIQDLFRDVVKGIAHSRFEVGLFQRDEMRFLTIAQFADDLVFTLSLRRRWGDNDGEHLVHVATLFTVDSLHLLDDGIAGGGATKD